MQLKDESKQLQVTPKDSQIYPNLSFIGLLHQIFNPWSASKRHDTVIQLTLNQPIVSTNECMNVESTEADWRTPITGILKALSKGESIQDKALSKQVAR